THNRSPWARPLAAVRGESQSAEGTRDTPAQLRRSALDAPLPSVSRVRSFRVRPCGPPRFPSDDTAGPEFGQLCRGETKVNREHLVGVLAKRRRRTTNLVRSCRELEWRADEP